MSKVAVVVLVLVVLAGGGYGLLQAADSRDGSSIDASTEGPGEPVPGMCPDTRANVTRDGGTLSQAEVLTALAQGNVILHGPDPAPLRAIQEAVSGPFDSELAVAGQMVIVVKDDELGARAFKRVLRAPTDDAALRDFAESWLGKGTDSCG